MAQFKAYRAPIFNLASFILHRSSMGSLLVLSAHYFVTGDTRVFSEEFANISVGSFDSNYPASLTLDCGWYGSIYLQAGAFANMSYIQHLKVGWKYRISSI